MTYGLPCTVRTATAAMPKWWTALSCMTRDAKRKKASRREQDSALQMATQFYATVAEASGSHTQYHYIRITCVACQVVYTTLQYIS